MRRFLLLPVLTATALILSGCGDMAEYEQACESEHAPDT